MKAAKDAKDARSNASSPSTMNIFERDKGEKAEPKGGKKRGEKVRERGADKEEESQAEEESWSKIDEILENSLSGDGKLTVGGMLMHFMYFYGTVFDAYSQKIDATEARGVPSKRTDDRKVRRTGIGMTHPQRNLQVYIPLTHQTSSPSQPNPPSRRRSTLKQASRATIRSSSSTPSPHP